MEVTPRFELGNEGFADPCLTTWLCHRMEKGVSTSKKDSVFNAFRIFLLS